MPEPTEPEITRDNNLVEKLAWIISDLPQLQKKGWNIGQKFNFISVEQMKREVLPRCADLGIVMYPKAIDRTLNYRDRFKDGNMIGLMTEVHLIMTWVITDGHHEIEVQTVGEALDAGDKAANKASTGGQKNLFKTVFGITEAGEDNDSNTPVPQGESTRRAPPPKSEPKRELTPKQKEFLGLKDQAIEAVQKLGRLKMVNPDEVVKGLIADGLLPEEFEDKSHIKHRAQAQELIDAVEKYIVDNSLEDPS